MLSLSHQWILRVICAEVGFGYGTDTRRTHVITHECVGGIVCSAALDALTLQSLSWSDLGLHWEGGYQIRDRHIIKESERGRQQRPGKTLEVGGRYKRRIREVYKEGYRRRDIVTTLDATRKYFRAYSKPPYFSSLVLGQRGEFFYTQMPVHVCVCHGVHVVTTQIQNLLHFMWQKCHAEPVWLLRPWPDQFLRIFLSTHMLMQAGNMRACSLQAT